MVQTVDTDLNQHVKREYAAVESVELIRQMRLGVGVPRCTPSKCIELMAGEVMSKLSLHLAAADGYLKTGLRVALDGSQDQEVVREAQHFWRDLGMRAKINSAVVEVREAFAAGTLRWCAEDVNRLIRPYPPKPKEDAVLAKLGEDTHLDPGEKAFDDGDEGNGSEGDGAGSEALSGSEGEQGAAGGRAG